MLTPAGTECPHFYGDYYRGRQTEECRLIAAYNEQFPNSLKWNRGLCKVCRVPKIVQANACANMVLEARVQKVWFGLDRRVKVIAFCLKSKTDVTTPEVGCGQCHGDNILSKLTLP